MPEDTNQMKPRRKMGKTILVSSQRNTDTVVDKSHLTEETLKGLLKTTDKDGKFFLLFEDSDTKFPNFCLKKNPLYSQDDTPKL